MKTLKSSIELDVPSGVLVRVRARRVRVKGPRGILERQFKHQQVDLRQDGNKIAIDMWHANRKQKAALRTIKSHIANMFTGVTKGFEYKMRFVAAHFPVNATIPDEGDFIEVRNFLGEKVVRRVDMPVGVKIVRSEVKDEIILSGNNVEDVSRACALIHQKCLVREKDIRKFLDGIYVSEKGYVVKDE